MPSACSPHYIIAVLLIIAYVYNVLTVLVPLKSKCLSALPLYGYQIGYLVPLVVAPGGLRSERSLRCWKFLLLQKTEMFVCGRSFHSCYEPVLANHRAVLATLTLKQRFAYPEKRTGLPQVAADTCMSAQQESGACVHDRVASGRIASRVRVRVRVRCVEHPSRRLPPGRPPAACRQSLLTRLLPRQHPHLRKRISFLSAFPMFVPSLSG